MSNAKSARNKPVEIKIGEEIYKLRFTLNSFIELEDIYGSIDVAMEALQGTPVIDKKTGKIVQIVDPDPKGEGKMIDKIVMNFKSVRDILWAGFIPDNPDISKVQVGNLLTMANIAEIMPKISEAIMGSLPEKVEDELKN